MLVELESGSPDRYEAVKTIAFRLERARALANLHRSRDKPQESRGETKTRNDLHSGKSAGGSQSSFANFKYFNCHELGHRAHECPKKEGNSREDLKTVAEDRAMSNFVPLNSRGRGRGFGGNRGGRGGQSQRSSNQIQNS